MVQALRQVLSSVLFILCSTISVICNASLDVSTKLTFAIDHSDISIQTEHSGRIPLHVAYPISSAQQHPLIVFSHGHYLSNRDYDALIDLWATEGYVVLAPLHLDTGDIAAVRALGEKLGSDWITAARVLDMRAALDQAATIAADLPNFNGSVTTDKIIAAGHSYGALSAQILGGAALEKQGNSAKKIPAKLHDKRVKAIVAISPPGLADDFISAETWQPLTTPQLVITGTNDVFEHVWQDYREHLIAYETAQSGHNYALVIDGMDHYMGKLIGRLNRDVPPQFSALERVLQWSLVFMRAYQAGDDKAYQQLNDIQTARAQTNVVMYNRR